MVLYMYTCTIYIVCCTCTSSSRSNPPHPPPHTQQIPFKYIHDSIHVHPLHMHIAQNIQAIVPAPPPPSLTVHGWDVCVLYYHYSISGSPTSGNVLANAASTQKSNSQTNSQGHSPQLFFAYVHRNISVYTYMYVHVHVIYVHVALSITTSQGYNSCHEGTKCHGMCTFVCHYFCVPLAILKPATYLSCAFFIVAKRGDTSENLFIAD